MLQFDGMASRFREHVACLPASEGRAGRLRRYIFSQRYVHRSVLRCCVHLSVASGPVPDVMGFIPDIAHTARTNSKPIRLQRISAFLPPASCGVSSGGLL